MSEGEFAPILKTGYTSADVSPAVISAAKLVRPEDYTECPQCGVRWPLMFGDPNGKYWCPDCQAEDDFNLKWRDNRKARIAAKEQANA